MMLGKNSTSLHAREMGWTDRDAPSIPAMREWPYAVTYAAHILNRLAVAGGPRENYPTQTRARASHASDCKTNDVENFKKEPRGLTVEFLKPLSKKCALTDIPFHRVSKNGGRPSFSTPVAKINGAPQKAATLPKPLVVGATAEEKAPDGDALGANTHNNIALSKI